jgi:hypothetical protein
VKNIGLICEESVFAECNQSRETGAARDHNLWTEFRTRAIFESLRTSGNSETKATNWILRNLDGQLQADAQKMNEITLMSFSHHLLLALISSKKAVHVKFSLQQSSWGSLLASTTSDGVNTEKKSL